MYEVVTIEVQQVATTPSVEIEKSVGVIAK